MNRHDDAMGFVHALQSAGDQYAEALSPALMLDLADNWLETSKRFQMILAHHGVSRDAPGRVRVEPVSAALGAPPAAKLAAPAAEAPPAEEPAPAARDADPRRPPKTVDPTGKRRPGQMVFISAFTVVRGGRPYHRPAHWRFRPHERR